MHTVFQVLKGKGIDGIREGMCKKGILAGFTHVHALGAPTWADALVECARRHRRTKQKQTRIFIEIGSTVAFDKQNIPII